MKKRYKVSAAFTLGISSIWLFNASFLAPTPDGSLTLMSHRGVHQTFDRSGVENNSCTADRIFRPTHQFIENTIPSIQAALEYGANMIELDIHPTTDGEFAVFHDWTLDCRTNGSGKVRDHSSSELKALDVGYGYTFDAGKTFPFRGGFVGAMPMLGDTLNSFPETRFLINIKSRSKNEGRQLVDYLELHNISLDRIVIYGHQNSIDVVEALKPEIMTMGNQQSKKCLISYATMGWFGHMPRACKETWVPVPENYRWLAWGWPNRFQERLSAVGSEVVLIGPHTSARSDPAIDTKEQLESIPDNFGGTVWTNRIEDIGPLLISEND